METAESRAARHWHLETAFRRGFHMIHLDIALLALGDQYKEEGQYDRLRSDMEAMLWSDGPSLSGSLALVAATVLAGMLWAIGTA
jgi:hypothetical protein